MLDCGDEGLAADDEAEPLRWYATPAEAAARLRTGALRWPPDAGGARGPALVPNDALSEEPAGARGGSQRSRSLEMFTNLLAS